MSFFFGLDVSGNPIPQQAHKHSSESLEWIAHLFLATWVTAILIWMLGIVVSILVSITGLLCSKEESNAALHRSNGKRKRRRRPS